LESQEKVRKEFKEEFKNQILGDMTREQIDETFRNSEMSERYIELGWAVESSVWVTALKALLNGRRFWVRIWPEVAPLCYDDGSESPFYRTYLRILLEKE